MASVLKLTLDTNCIINALDVSSLTRTSVAEVTELIRLGFDHIVHIAITTRVEADLRNDKNSERRDMMLAVLSMFPVIATVGRFGSSQFDSGDIFTDEHTRTVAKDMLGVLFPGMSDDDRRRSNKLHDVDHLLGHRLQGRNIFVTDDRSILNKDKALVEQFGIEVHSPKSCLELVMQLHRAASRPAPVALPDGEYSSAKPFGRVTFDYSNNDGKYKIGTGVWLFETHWSRAGQVDIHAYRNEPNITAIAHVKGVASI